MKKLINIFFPRTSRDAIYQSTISLMPGETMSAGGNTILGIGTENFLLKVLSEAKGDKYTFSVEKDGMIRVIGEKTQKGGYVEGLTYESGHLIVNDKKYFRNGDLARLDFFNAIKKGASEELPLYQRGGQEKLQLNYHFEVSERDFVFKKKLMDLFAYSFESKVAAT